MQEWLEHYFFHGVDHVYMINDQSTDSFMDVLQPYIDQQLVTLFQSTHPYYLGRQRDMYNHFFLPILSTTRWFGIVDMDEFLYSKRNVDLRNVLKTHEHLAQIQFNHTLFGSSGLDQQPEWVVPSFTYREDTTVSGAEETSGIIKYLLNTEYEFVSLNIHHAEFADKENLKNGKFRILDYKTVKDNVPPFTLNHYRCQSKQFWNDVKCTRGDSDHYIQRNKDMFHTYDKNDVQDTTLYEQNKVLYLLLALRRIPR
jgi:hypothetical protein